MFFGIFIVLMHLLFVHCTSVSNHRRHHIHHHLSSLLFYCYCCCCGGRNCPSRRLLFPRRQRALMVVHMFTRCCILFRIVLIHIVVNSLSVYECVLLRTSARGRLGSHELKRPGRIGSTLSGAAATSCGRWGPRGGAAAKAVWHQ